MTDKEYKRKWYSEKTGLMRLACILVITQVKVVRNSKGVATNYKVRHLNPYNPLSYVALLFMLPIQITKAVFTEVLTVVFEELKTIFKYH